MKKWIISKRYLFLLSIIFPLVVLAETNNSDYNSSQTIATEANQEQTTTTNVDQTSYVKTDFDYAEKALANKKPEEALLGFERVLMYDPNNYQAQLGMSVALYQLNLLAEATQTLQNLIKSSPPKDIYAQATTLLQMVNEAIQKRFNNQIYVGLNGGYDTNVTVATEENFIQILALEGITLGVQHLTYNPGDGAVPSGVDPAVWNIIWHNYLSTLNDIDRTYQFEQFQSQALFLNSINDYNGLKEASFYVTPQVGDRGSYSPNKKLLWFWDVNMNYQDYFTAKDFNNSQANLSTGISYFINPKYTIDASVYYQEYLLDNKNYQNTPMVNLGLERMINANNIIKIFTNDGLSSYPQDSSTNLNMYQGGIQWTNTDFLQTHIFIAQVVFGEYLSRDDSTPYNSSTYYGFNLNDLYRLTAKTSLGFSAMYQHSMFKAIQYPYADREKDEYLKLDGTLSYLLTPKLAWTFTLSFSNNFSNIFAKKYNRYQFDTGINYAF